MGRPKRLYPLGRYRLHIRGEIDPAKQYLVQLEYTWNRQVIRKGMNIFVRLGDWNEKANKGRGGVRASYGPEANRINSLLLARAYKIDVLLAEYHQKHPNHMTSQVIADFLADKPLTREDKGKDFIEFVLERLESDYSRNRIGRSRYENGKSGMNIFRIFLRATKNGTYKPDSIYLGEISVELIDEYIRWRREIKQNSDATINHALTPILKACAYASEMKMIDHAVNARIQDMRIASKISLADEDNEFDGIMQLNKACEFHFQPDWYRGFEYPKEQERGYDFNEDLYVPGYFEVDIKKGESIVFSAGTSEVTPRRLKQTFEAEVADRTPRDSFYHCLKNSAHQFHNQQEGEHYILAGYPWFKCRARDMFISLPGLTLALDEVDQFEDVMKTAEKAIRSFINDEPAGYKIYEMEHPDVLLWAVWALQQYAKETSREQCRQKYGELLKDIIEFIRQRKHENLFLHENGLLYANGTDKAITWMNSTVNGHPVIPRTGYIVEFNALWYNALRFVADLVREDGNVLLADALDAQAEVTGKSFIEVFRNEYGYLLDYVDGNMMDWSVRPNMIFAVAFDYSPLDRAQKKQVLDIATKELLTPKGLRTLSPKSGGYNPNYVGPQIQRDYAYHQGTAWPWLMGFYMEAYLRIYKMSGLSFIERQLIGLEDELTIHCISSLPELFDGNPPFKGRGAVSFAMNVAEVLRILKLLSKYY